MKHYKQNIHRRTYSTRQRRNILLNQKIAYFDCHVSNISKWQCIVETKACLVQLCVKPLQLKRNEKNAVWFQPLHPNGNVHLDIVSI